MEPAFRSKALELGTDLTTRPPWVASIQSGRSPAKGSELLVTGC